VQLYVICANIITDCDWCCCTPEQGKRMVIYTAFFSNLHYMFAGALLAALGVCLMHYCGMIAMWGNFEIE
jgi:hypothetical protein